MAPAMIPSVSRGNPVTIACWFSLSKKSKGGSLVYSTLNRLDFSSLSWIRYIMPATNATANPTVPNMLKVTCTHTVLSTGSSVGTSLGKAAAESRERKAIGKKKHGAHKIEHHGGHKEHDRYPHLSSYPRNFSAKMRCFGSESIASAKQESQGMPVRRVWQGAGNTCAVETLDFSIRGV